MMSDTVLKKRQRRGVDIKMDGCEVRSDGACRRREGSELSTDESVIQKNVTGKPEEIELANQRKRKGHGRKNDKGKSKAK